MPPAMSSPAVHSDVLTPPRRREPIVREIVAAWRGLTGGAAVRDHHRLTLIACSAGADSSALVLALSTVRPAPVVAHIVHDLRPEAEALADRDATRQLAEQLDLRFVEARVAVAGLQGNAESLARDLRYQALDDLADRMGCRFIATGHHGDDQIETVLMRLMRGAGPRGLAGIPSSRQLEHARVIRPMLSLDRARCRELCERCGWSWSEDRTNSSSDRLRSAIREHIAPELARLAPGLAGRVGSTCELLGQAAQLVEREAQAILESAECSPGEIRLGRSVLADQPGIVVGEVVRLCARRLTAGVGQDRLSAAALATVAATVCDGDPKPRRFVCGPIVVHVQDKRVDFRATVKDG